MNNTNCANNYTVLDNYSTAVYAKLSIHISITKTCISQYNTRTIWELKNINKVDIETGLLRVISSSPVLQSVHNLQLTDKKRRNNFIVAYIVCTTRLRPFFGKLAS